MARHIIVGVDPGSTIGLAALDLSGRTVATSHSLGGGFEDAISIIEKWGTPSLIAVDVRPAPSFAVRVAASFNVPLFVPARPWREEEKSALVKHLRASVQNVHERDALSAAVLAWRANQNSLMQSISQEGFGPDDIDQLRHLALQGIRYATAIEMLKEKKLPKEEAAPKHAPAPAKPASSHLSSLHVPSLEKTISELRKRVAFLENENDSLRRKLQSVEGGAKASAMRDLIVQRLKYDVERLKREIDRMRHCARAQKKARAASQGNSKSHPAQPAVQEKPASLKALDEREERLERMIGEYRKGRAGR